MVVKAMTEWAIKPLSAAERLRSGPQIGADAEKDNPSGEDCLN